MGLVGGGEDLGFVDVVDPEGFEDLGFDEVADAGFRHDRDGYSGHDFFDEGRIAHAGDAAVGADIGRDAFEGHDGDGAGFFGDAGVLGGDDVHDDAAFEHLSQAFFDGKGGDLLFHNVGLHSGGQDRSARR